MKPSEYDGRGHEPPYPTLEDDNAMLVADNQKLRAENDRLNAENRALLKDRKVLHDAVNGICYTIEKNNEQSGFWGVASAHGLIRSKCIDAMEKVREAAERQEG